MTFAALGLSEPLLRAVSDQGYAAPTPIQSQAIPAVLAGADVLAGAQTGTGKTAGFVLPILERLSQRGGVQVPSPRQSHGAHSRPPRRHVRVLIVTPTRELAAQVEASVRAYGKYTGLTSAVIFGGVGFGNQMAALKRGVDIVVATPGRLLDHHAQRNVDLSRVEILVLDEADRMLDMGFLPDIKRILALLPGKRQNLMFSATYSDEIRKLAEGLLHQPRAIEVAPRNATVEVIRQKAHPVDRERKQAALAWLIGHHRWEQVLVFTRTKHGANKLAEQLERDGIRAGAIHGNKSQGARERALADFKGRRLRVLVATDIAARGIDIDALPRVVNYDLPNVPEDYVHRIGRTGRAGADGEAISLVSVDDRAFLRDIERLIRRPIEQETIPGFEPNPNARAQPVAQRRGAPRASARGSAPPRSAASHAARKHGQREQRRDGAPSGPAHARAGSHPPRRPAQRTR